MADGKRPEDEPGEAAAADGMVLLDGPDGVAVSLTPDSAEKTADNLREAAAEARRQESGH